MSVRARARIPLAIVNSYYPPIAPGGAEESVRLLSEALVSEFEVHVLTLGTSEVRTDVRKPTIVRQPLRNVYDPLITREPRAARKAIWHLIDAWNPAMAGALRKHYRQIEPEVILTNNVRGFSVAAWTEAAHLRIPVIHTLRDYSLLCNSSTMYRNDANCTRICGSCRFRSRASTRASAHVRHVVGISRAVLDAHLRSGIFGNTPSSVIHNAPPDDVFVPLESEVQYDFGYIGQISEAKGLVDVISALQASNGAPTMLVAGDADTPEGRRVRAEASGLPVHFAGYVTRAEFFKAVKCVVVPSRWREPFGRVVLEASAAGKRLLIADQPGLREAAAVCSADSTVFAAGDPRSLALAMEAVLGAKVTRDRVVEQRDRPSWQAPHEAYSDLIRRVTSQGSGSYSGVLERRKS